LAAGLSELRQSYDGAERKTVAGSCLTTPLRADGPPYSGRRRA
jgi:hypothetical protein